jgi:hypothetical protein
MGKGRPRNDDPKKGEFTCIYCKPNTYHPNPNALQCHLQRLHKKERAAEKVITKEKN